jgi:DNA-binding IscR family transcriptional regulator
MSSFPDISEIDPEFVEQHLKKLKKNGMLSTVMGFHVT